MNNDECERLSGEYPEAFLEEDDLSLPEPIPIRTSGRPIWELVKEDMERRDKLGREKYGTPLQAHNGRNALVDLYQELLDAVVYTRQVIEEDGGEVPSRPHAASLALEVVRLNRRVDELLAHNTDLREAKREIDLQANVTQFHRAMNLPIGVTPHVLSDDRVRFRLRLITEEYLEIVASCLLDQSHPQFQTAKHYLHALIEASDLSVDFPEFIDGLEDLKYVVEGTHVEAGVDSTPMSIEVHRANMSKLGPDGKPVMDGHKVIKPPGFRPPDIEGKLREQGWRG